MPSQPSIEQFYSTTVQPALDELEAVRRAALGRCVTAGLIIGLLALLLFASAAMIFQNVIFPLIICSMGAAFAWFWTTSGPLERYRSSFKQRVVRELVRLVGQDLRYAPAEYISEGEYLAGRIYLRDPDRFKGEDLVSGRHGQTEFRFSEIHSEYKTTSTDSKGNTKTSWHTIFKGVFFIADFNKNFNGLTVVLPDSSERALGFIGRTLQSWGATLDSRQGELVSLEDPEFEREFAVYATDQVEARYILSPSLMRRILDYKRKNSRTIALSFNQSRIYVAISTNKNLFEAPSLFAPIHSSLGPEQIRAYLEDLLMVFSIVDELDLNTRIWSKLPEPIGQ